VTFRRLAEEATPPLQEFCAGLLPYAQKHADIVQRFGRFPHRNAVLERPSTPEEVAWLTTGERFGQ
jgi:uncharacterized protein (DUF924 family)